MMSFGTALLLALSLSSLLWFFLTSTQEKELRGKRIDELVPSTGMLEKGFYEKEKIYSLGYPRFDHRSVIAMLGLFCTAIVFSLLWESKSPDGYALKLVACLGAAALSLRIWKIRRIKAYRLRIEEELPTALDLLIVCIEAGMSIHSALVKVAEETKGSPLSDELRHTFQELHLGRTLEEAFRNLGMRTDVADVQALATAVIQADKLGMSLAETLRNQARMLREVIRLRTREKILKIPIKLVIPLVLFIMPAIFTVVAGPAFIEIMSGLFSDILSE